MGEVYNHRIELSSPPRQWSSGLEKVCSRGVLNRASYGSLRVGSTWGYGSCSRPSSLQPLGDTKVLKWALGWKFGGIPGGFNTNEVVNGVWWPAELWSIEGGNWGCLVPREALTGVCFGSALVSFMSLFCCICHAISLQHGPTRVLFSDLLP